MKNPLTGPPMVKDLPISCPTEKSSRAIMDMVAEGTSTDAVKSFLS